MSDLADLVRVMVHGFGRGDSRRADVRAIADRIEALEAKAERLRVLVSDAYVEGYKRGSAGVPRGLLDAEHAWTQSAARAALAAGKGGGHVEGR